MTCADCGRKLRYAGRGRPPARCARCQTKHRREYLRDHKRRSRAETARCIEF